MTKETGINDDIGIAAGAFQDFTKRAIGAQSEFVKKYSEAYWHWQERIQIEATQLTEFFKHVCLLPVEARVTPHSGNVSHP